MSGLYRENWTDLQPIRARDLLGFRTGKQNKYMYVRMYVCMYVCMYEIQKIPYKEHFLA